MDAERRAQAFRSFDEAVELPMLALAIAFVPVIVVPHAFTLSPTLARVFETLNWIIWAAFATELSIKTYLAPRRGRFLLSHWFDVLIVVLPLLRPLRLARSVRAVRALAALRLVGVAARAADTVRELLRQHGLHYTLLSGGMVVVGCAAAVAFFERDAGGSIGDFGDALWWAAVTVTTVGYGDTYPVTPAGRGVGVFLMCVGIALFGLITANIAAFFVESSAKRERSVTLDDLLAQMQRLEERLARLQDSVGGPSGRNGEQPRRRGPSQPDADPIEGGAR